MLAGLAAAVPTAAYASEPVAAQGVGTANAAQAIADCAPMAGTPYRVGTTVKADVTSYGCSNGWTFSATLQSSRWDGWNPDDTVNWYGSTHRVLNDYNCSGEHDHRVALYATSPTGFDYPVHFSRTVRLNCG
ncbi:hypothetical protein HDA32_003141 [Spinactinospora alkalitolerans]|uniref:Secreted protein n=1 Tax=Spinactinospora alkalitolerans TaxID=687207 RepID=A0A852TWB9_9ACTN|nr:hypothetical protein [Spinactinospora alkalitolerans]NYE48021.1 hypothetical protein [Spinactinospora alkalitolerans]